MQKSLPSLVDHPVPRFAAEIRHRPSSCNQPVTVAARKSRPFQKKVVEVGGEEPEEYIEQTDDEILTAAYLADLSTEEWEDDPPNHRSGAHRLVIRYSMPVQAQCSLHRSNVISPGKQGWRLTAQRVYELLRHYLSR